MSGSVSVAALTTTNTTPTLIPGLPQLPNTTGTNAVSITGQVIALNPVTGSAAVWNVVAAVTGIGAAAPVVVGTPTITLLNTPAADLAGVTLTFSLQASGVGLLATGAAATTLNWTATLIVAADSAPGSTAAGVLVESDKVDVRRFCGYPAYGAGPAGFQGWRFFQAYGLLEYRLDNLDPTEVAVVQTYLGNLRTLEQAIPAAGANLDTDKAAVWTHNKEEVADRLALFDGWRRRLCGFLGLPAGPALTDGAVRLVV